MKQRLLSAVLALLLLGSLILPAQAAGLPFTDVKPDSWYYAAVSELYSRKLVSGTSATVFSPTGTVSLGQALKMVLLAAGYPEQKPVDDHWASGYFALAKSKGLLPAGRFNTLNSPITRLQIAELAVKALGLTRTKSGKPFSDTTDANALIAYDHGIFTGTKSGSALLFQPGATINRAEMSAVTWRICQQKAAGTVSANLTTTVSSGGPAAAASGANQSGTYIQFAGTKVYVAEDIPKNPYDPALFQFNSNGYLTYDSADYTCAIGIDVSKYQGTIDWAKVRASGVQFAILRLGYRGYKQTGGLALDSTFAANLQGAQAAGIQVGVYFFSQAITPQEAVEEADFCINALQPYRITYPVVYDWEPYDESVGARTNGLDDATLTACSKAFLDRVKAAGYTPMLYSNPTYFYRHLDMSQLTGYQLWLANYVSMTSFYYQYDMWQYSCTGSVPGIQGAVDLNIQMIKK